MTEPHNPLPIAGLAKRQMRMLYLVDCSGSMSIDGKMDTLNRAMEKVQGEIRRVADSNPQANVMVQTLRFSSGATWTTPEPTPVASFQWHTLQPDKLDRSDPGWVREMRQQLVDAGAHAGKLQIGLHWKDRNDLDLQVVCPHGKKIFYGHKQASCCGGWLDIDMNVRGETTSPIEHITFGHGEDGTPTDIPAGEYKISVNFYKRHGLRAKSDFKVLVVLDGQTWKTYEKSVRNRGETQLIDVLRMGGENPSGLNQPNSGTGGNTDFGAALTTLAAALKSPPHPKRAIPPLIVLLSDGEPTDDYEGPLAALDSLPWARKAQRFAIAIGRDADRGVLQEFTQDPTRVLDANSPERLATLIQWCSTQVLQSSLTARRDSDSAGAFMPPPPPPGISSADDEPETW